jgi:hypothetical protein
MHCKDTTENPKQIFPEIKLCGLILTFHIHVSVSALNIPTIGSSILLQKISGPIVEIYINWERGRTVFISGNTEIGSSLQPG